MQKANRASIEFSIKWQSRFAIHQDRMYAGKVDFWRDIFPKNMDQPISKLDEGKVYEESFSAGVLVPPFDQNRIIEFKNTLFERQQGNITVVPKLGRFYPQGFAWKALNCYRGNYVPFRLIEMDKDVMVADTNHPLANYPITLSAKYLEKIDALEEHGGLCNDIAELVTKSGPGMQTHYIGVAADYYESYPLKRNNDSGDAAFYKQPRYVKHLDDTALSQVEAIYGRLLPSESRILDLMSSCDSHINHDIEDCDIVGLGLNEDELKSNKRLAEYVVHDLNNKPILPFENNEFDAVVCTSSIEYLTQPIEVISEVARVTKSGGLFVSTFSDRWFPGKEILLWSNLHAFERLGLVLDYYIKTDMLENLHTETVRGYPRPIDDKHIQKTAMSDPIFAVWGTIKK